MLPYLFGALGLASAIYSISTARLAYRSPIERRWLWVLCSLACSPTVRLDTATGSIGTQLISVTLLGLGWVSTPAGSIVIVAFPAGALLFRQRRRSLIARNYPATPLADLDRI